MGAFGPIHWLIVGLVLLLLFGNRLPSVMRSLGLGVVEFKKGLQGVQDEIDKSCAAKDKDKEKIEQDQVKKE
jgi:sec-independent protein translocase protein TatA